MLTYIQLDIYIRIFPTQGACQRINKKRKGEDHHDSYKVKTINRPFAEGSRGCHVLLCLDAQNLNGKECHFIFPLVIWTFIMEFFAFILCHHKFVQRSILYYTKWSKKFRSTFYCLIAPMKTYLKDLTQSIARYGGLSWQNWFRDFGSTSSISTWCWEFG